MEGMKKRVLAVFLALFLTLGMLPGTARAAAVDSGECGKNGNNVTWSLDSNGTLTISGSGEMQSFGSFSSPWFVNASIYDITSVVIEDGVTSIGDYAFQAHGNLLSVSIPDSVTSIGSSAFSDCSSLTGVTLPDNVIFIGDKAFFRCTGLTNAVVPNSAASIGTGVWDGCSKLSAITVNSGNLSYTSEDGVLYSKDMKQLVQYPAGKTDTSYRIPDSVNVIDAEAFSGCSGLTSISIPDGVTIIEQNTFSDCNGLRSVTLPDSVTTIEDGAFSGCSSLADVTLPDGLTSIGSYAFSNCGSLTSVTIPDSVTAIRGYGAFSGCSSLASVTIPASVTFIVSAAFSGCNKLSDVYYSGTEDAWKQIQIGERNDPLRSAELHTKDDSQTYEITEYDIPTKASEYHDGRIVSAGPFSEFADLYIDGIKLDRGTDYTAEAGSTIVTIRRAVFEKFGIGKHTISLEFSPQGGESGAVRIALDYAIKDDAPQAISLPGGVKYIPYSWVPEQAGGTYAAVGTLPGGLALDGKTGEISGVPRTNGTWEIAVRQTVTEDGQSVTKDLIYGITVQNNTDDNVQKLNDYDIINPVGTEISINHFVLDSYRDETLIINGPYREFTKLYIDGRLLVRDQDYKAHEGSTVITIPGQTLEKQGAGTHTIAAEYRDAQGTLKKAAQNYTAEAAAPIRVTLDNGVKYVPYAWTPESASGKYTTVGTLPSGLSLNPDTGEISGVPQADGTWEVAVRQTASENGQAVTNDLIYVITVQNNTDSNVQKPNDYEIIDPVGTEIGFNHFVLDSYRDETLIINGPYKEFTKLYIDGKLLILHQDYEAHEGSTVITIFGQTFAQQGTGTHTISAEFRTAQGKLKTVSQNYTVNISTPTRPAVTAKPSTTTTTTKPADPTPAPAPEEPAAPEGLPFGDVSPEDWFYGDVVWAYEGEIMAGVTATSFAPQTSISQATIVTVLSRMANIDLTKFSGVTDDVISSGHWYTDAAIWAKQSGLLPDYDVFTGNETISRDQMAIMLSKYLQSIGKDTTPPSQPVAFADAGEMSQAGNDAFQVLYAYNIFRGVGDGRMDPAGSTTRAQFAALVHRISGLI